MHVRPTRMTFNPDTPLNLTSLPLPLIDDTITQSLSLSLSLSRILSALPSTHFARLDVAFETERALREGTFKVYEIDMPPFGDRREKAGEAEVRQTPASPLSLSLSHSPSYPSLSLSLFYAGHLGKLRTVSLNLSLGFSKILGFWSFFWSDPFEILTKLTKIVARNEACGFMGVGKELSPFSPGVI